MDMCGRNPGVKVIHLKLQINVSIKTEQTLCRVANAPHNQTSLQHHSKFNQFYLFIDSLFNVSVSLSDNTP